MNTFNLSRLWFSFAFDNPEVKPVHTALYFWILERGNTSGWKRIIDIQTEKSMDCLGITDWRTYKNALQFLVDNKFILWIEKSKNQYTCNRVSIASLDGEISESYKNASANYAEADAEAIVEALAEAYAEADVEAIAEALQSYINLKTNKPINPKTKKGNGASAPKTKPLTKQEKFQQVVAAELETLDEEHQSFWHKFDNWYTEKNFKKVTKIPDQLTPLQFYKLLEFCHVSWIRDRLDYMENRQKLNYQSIYLTLLNWIKKDVPTTWTTKD